jgi:hypothetical protein
MIVNRKYIALASFTLVAALAACGGGGGGGGSSVPSSSQPAVTPTPAAIAATPTAPALSSGQAIAKFSISKNLTTTSSTSRRAQFVDPNTNSITFSLLTSNGVSLSGPLQGPYSLTTGATGCTVSGTTLTCTFSIAAPIGSDVFLATTYASTDGSGVALGSGAVTLSVAQNSSNQANLVLTGPVASVVAVSNNSANEDTLWNGSGTFYPITAAQYASYQTASVNRRPQTLATSAPTSAPTVIPSERLYLIAQDVNGSVILNPTTYNVPISVKLALNGGPANVTLTDTPPAGIGCSTQSVTTDGASVAVCSPTDVLTLSLINGIASPALAGGLSSINANFPSLTIGSGISGFTALTFPFTVEAVPQTVSLPVVGQ